MNALQVIEIYAGEGPNGQPVVERLQVKVADDDTCQLVKSPAFIKGIASGDVIKMDRATGQFELVRRSGNLSIRVFSKRPIEDIAEVITPHLEKLGGELDIDTPRMLVYSIHVSCGFDAIENILNKAASEEVTWLYGNVYAADGTTPLNWWQDILKPQ